MIAVTGAAFVISLVGASSSIRSLGPGSPVGVRMGPTRLAAASSRTRSLRLYYTPPILVRRGERVVMPVDVVCATDGGTPCAADVQIGTQVGTEAWHSVHAAGAAGGVDFTAPAARAGSSGIVRFYLRATDGVGTVSSLGTGGRDGALRFHVTDRMPVVSMPAVPFGDVREGQIVVALPWGTGPMRAGLELGNESETVGPGSFDVDASGRIFLLDGLQERLAVFDGGRLIREVRLPGGPHLDVAAVGDGSAYVLSRSRSGLVVQHVDGAGSIGPAASLGQAIGGYVEAVGAQAFADLFPLDAWVKVPHPGGSLPDAPQVHVGRPMAAGGELLRSARPDSIRLGILSGDRVMDAVEIRSSTPLGEIELAEPDQSGGHWAVIHVWRDQPEPADQYQVVHVRGNRILSSFGASARHFATVPPLNRFRLGRDGFLYQMTSSPEGIRIVRYELGGEA